MGLSFSGLFSRFFGNEERKLAMVGLDAAGKTTILYRLRIGEVVTTIPTIGFNVEEVQYKSVTFTVWDIGGQDRIRPLWRHYYMNLDGVIFVVDCNDRERLPEAKEELDHILRNDDLRGCTILVFANKQDLPDAVTASELGQKLGLLNCNDHPWHIQPSQATTGDGLYEGLDWLSSHLKKRK